MKLRADLDAKHIKPITRRPSLHWNAFVDPLHAPIKKGKEKSGNNWRQFSRRPDVSDLS